MHQSATHVAKEERDERGDNHVKQNLPHREHDRLFDLCMRRSRSLQAAPHHQTMIATISGLMNGPMKLDITVLKSVVAGFPCEFRVNITLGAIGGAVLPTMQNLESSE